MLLSLVSFSIDPWHNWSTCVKRKVDWDKWKENYTERTRNIYTHLCGPFWSILVYFSSFSLAKLYYEYELFLEWKWECSGSGWHLFSFSYFIFPLYRYTTSPHLFSGDAEEAFIRVRSKVCLVNNITLHFVFCLVMSLCFALTI